MEKILVKERIIKDGKLIATPGMYLTVEEAKKLGLVKEENKEGEKKELVIVKEVKVTKKKRGKK